MNKCTCFNTGMAKYLIAILIIALGAAGLWYTMKSERAPEQDSTVAQATYANADEHLIKVALPLPGETVDATFTVLGQARGNWYFEASFPLEVRAEGGRVLVQMPVQAQGDWMTTEFVPFSAHVTVSDYRGSATLVLHNDNASGLPEHDRSISIPIVIQ
jgi:hypothetical protein